MESGFLLSLLSMFGIALAFFLILWLIMKGWNIFVTAFLCVAVVALTGAIDPYTAYRTHYMEGFVGFMRSNYLVLLTGALIGKMMEVTKGAKAVSKQLIRWFGADRAIISLPLACGILDYAGVSAFGISFCVFPIALQIFKEAGYPRRFLPAAIAFGCSTFAMIAPGGLQVHNAIPANILGTELTAGFINGFIGCAVTLVVGCVWMSKLVRDAKANGERFVPKPTDVFTEADEEMPNFWVALIPLTVAVLLVNYKITTPEGAKVSIVNLESGLLIGATLGYLMMYRYQDENHKAFSSFVANLTEAFQKSMAAISNICAVVGFGTVVRQAAAFPVIIGMITSIPGPDLVGASLAMYFIAGITGSASGALGLGTKIIADAYPAVAPAIMHRALALASATFDSLPHNGYVITVTNSICNETHKDAYGAVFKLTVIPPVIGSIVAIILFTLFPAWP